MLGNQPMDNPLLKYAEVPDPKRAFWCDNWQCGNAIYVGHKYCEKDERRMCMDCERLYGDGGVIKIAEENE